jgi:Endosomal/lysosomal potassium channel TMEM175
VTRRMPNTERVGAFSDGVFAVVITIMVLELKPPEHPSFAALALLWPTALSYAVSYLFIAIGVLVVLKEAKNCCKTPRNSLASPGHLTGLAQDHHSQPKYPERMLLLTLQM